MCIENFSRTSVIGICENKERRIGKKERGGKRSGEREKLVEGEKKWRREKARHERWRS